MSALVLSRLRDTFLAPSERTPATQATSRAIPSTLAVLATGPDASIAGAALALTAAAALRSRCAVVCVWSGAAAPRRAVATPDARAMSPAPSAITAAGGAFRPPVAPSGSTTDRASHAPAALRAGATERASCAPAVSRAGATDAASRAPAAPRVGIATVGARRLVESLVARGLVAVARGRLVTVALPAGDVEARAAAERTLAAAGDAPVVLVVAGPRPPALDPLLAAVDRIVIVPPPDAPSGLEALAVDAAAHLGRSTAILRLPRTGSAGHHLLTATGLLVPPSLRTAANSALEGGHG